MTPVRLTVLVGLLLLAGCDEDEARADVGSPVDGGAVPASEIDLVALSWNLGNLVESQPYTRRMRSLAFEQHVATQLRELVPDLVGLQEVLSPFECAAVDERVPSRTCFGVTEQLPPVRRLLGPDYSIACDGNHQSACVGVHVGFGRIRGVEPGGLALAGADTPRLPFEPCESAECAQETGAPECLDFTSVSSVLVDTGAFGTVRVVNVHLHPWGPPCQWAMERSAFALVDDTPTIVLGDWNFDPRAIETAPGRLWAEHVGEGRRFTSHHPTDAEARPIPTKDDGRSLDRLITDFAIGLCEVRSDPPLHAGFDFAAAGIAGEAKRQPDHFAVVCPLAVP